MSFRRLISPSTLFLALLFLGGCSGNWGWYVVNPSTPAGQRNLMFLLDGLYYTIALSVTAILISIILGLLVALPGLASQRPARVVNRVYVELVRAVPILVLTPKIETARRMGLLWGTHAVHTKDVDSFEDMVAKAKRMALRQGIAKAGDRVIVCAGVPFGTPGSTNVLHVVRILGDELKNRG